MTMKIKELENTCVLSENPEMGAEIIALYVKAGFENIYNLKGEYPRFYYGPIDMPHIQHSPDVIGIRCRSITLDQLREIVNGINQALTIQPDEFKAGDEVEVSVAHIPGGDKVYNTVTWTGGKTKSGQFICELNSGIIYPYSEIRKPQNKVRDAAEKSSELQEATYTKQHKVTYIHGFIDGAKWGQQNPEVK
jgi:hypothetical protein